MYPLDLSPSSCAFPLKSTNTDYRSFSVSSDLVTKTNKDAKMPAFTQVDKNRCVFTKKDRDSGKRGRPRADLLSALMIEGSSSKSRIRCDKCGRAFPREKSLQAHLRTHTGEYP